MATVVLVDDHDSQREIYELALSTAGFVVHEAASGERAIEMVHVLRPDVVVLDLAMPKLDGWEVCRRLKSDPNARHPDRRRHCPHRAGSSGERRACRLRCLSDEALPPQRA